MEREIKLGIKHEGNEASNQGSKHAGNVAGRKTRRKGSKEEGTQT